ncbi:hypothetical protein BG006_005997 [Podila minutissima]|uniref:Sm domain-containing protein n=1 Tax=Podila minutissima TaxID=64525 RepID=A0A9P5SLU6_9FUNG|nr:hypothetical protein BG006_005997 [Podila minutissima]
MDSSLEHEDPPLVAKLRSLLNRNTRIEITDGRLFVGHFMCIDHSKNIILAGAYESRPNAPLAKIAGGEGGEAKIPQETGAESRLAPDVGSSKKGDEDRRFVGLVMIPGHHIVRAEMDCSHLRGADSRIRAPKYDAEYLLGKR